METSPKSYDDVVALYKDQLVNSTTTAKFGDETFEFIPLTTMYELASESSVREMFASSKLDPITIGRLNERIRSDGIRLFALAIYCGLSPPDIALFLTAYDDHNLPFLPDDQLGKSERLTDPIFNAICNAQSLFIAPVFCESQYRSNFTGHPIPIEFTKGTKPDVGEGSGGKVYKARIHNSYVSFFKQDQWPDGWSRYFAFKVSKFWEDAERERKFLEVQAKHEIEHKHITTFYTGFEFENRLYLVAELADGNLEQFMAKYPKREVVGDLDREWLLDQLHGLAAALFTVHSLIVVYHLHDIKPTNILVFSDPSSGVKHRLKFTDFGSAGSGSTFGPTGSSAKSKIKGSTPTLPPETHNNGLSSRPHDVWSLGCVFLDILVWYHRGWKALTEFRVKVMEESEA